MADRIPPVKDPNAEKPSPWTEIAFTITPTLKDAKVVVFQVLDNSDNNGTANLLNETDQPLPSVYYQASEPSLCRGHEPDMRLEDRW